MDKRELEIIADYALEANIELLPEERFKCPARDEVPDLVEKLGHELTDEEYVWLYDRWDFWLKPEYDDSYEFDCELVEV